MKTKVTLFLFVFLGSLVSQTFAQDKANSANQSWSESTYIYGIMVWCDGEVVDVLEGEVRIHDVSNRFENGRLKMREIRQLNGELTSTKTGEVFRFNTIMKTEEGKGWVWSGGFSYNMKGDEGTKYSAKIHWDYSSGTEVITALHAVCH